MKHPILYEINTRCWLRELSDQADKPITLATVPDAEFDRWARFGFTHIWLMGVWTTGPRSRAAALMHPDLRRAYNDLLPGWQDEDVPGSPYAIADYQVPAKLGGEGGLSQFRKKLHEHNLRLMLDFVPNHLGLDHQWVRERPNLFVQSQGAAPGTFQQETINGTRWLAHGKDPYFPGWTDTVQLDYRQPETRTAMKELLGSIAERCDGVRCDMAMLLLNDVFARTWEQFPLDGQGPQTMEFWEEGIPEIKAAHPGFMFLAEVYWGLEPRLRALGFDFTYDKALYDSLVFRDARAVHAHLLGMAPEWVAGSAHFLENHDEPRIASILSPAEQRVAALLILSLPGMRFLHEGQLSGARCKIPVQLGRRPVELKQPEIEKLYRQLLTILRFTAVGRGSADLLQPEPAWAGNPTAQNFVIIQWRGPGRTERPGASKFDPSEGGQPVSPAEEGNRLVDRHVQDEHSPEISSAFDLVVVNLAPHWSQCYVKLKVEGLSQYDWTMKDLMGRERYLRRGEEMQRRGLYLDVAGHGAQLFHFEPVRR